MQHRSDRKKMPLQSSAFQHRLASYVLAAGTTGVSLLVTSQPSEAEVVYTPAHHSVGQDQAFAIDLNHDGVTDFRLENALRHNSGYRGAQLQVNAFATGGVVGIRSFARALSAGDVIGPHSPFRGGDEPMAFEIWLYGESTYSFGSWFNASSRYLGFRFKIDGQVHYGWARISTRSTNHFKIWAELTGYAYETEPNAPIVAGNTGSGNNDGENTTAGGPGPIHRISESRPLAAPTLAALSLGADGLSIWRREETSASQ
jgi:hypothetical protein